MYTLKYLRKLTKAARSALVLRMVNEVVQTAREGYAFIDYDHCILNAPHVAELLRRYLGVGIRIIVKNRSSLRIEWH